MSKVKYVTAPGIAGYPWLQPGRPDTAFGNTDGKYKTNLRLSPEDAAPLIVIIDKLKSEVFTSKDNVRVPFDKDEETGEVVFKLSSKFQPKYFDARGNPIPEPAVPLLYSGSTLRCSGFAEKYINGANKGISLRISAVQVIDPVSGSGGSAGDFDAVEGFSVGAGAPSEDFGSDAGYDF